MTYMIERPTTEFELADALAYRVSELWSTATAVREFASPGGGRCDISVLARGRIHSIEVKLYDWRRAIAQAVLNRYWSDRCYVALWHSVITDQVEAEARDFGIGLIEIRPDRPSVRLGAKQGKPKRSLKRQAVVVFAQ